MNMNLFILYPEIVVLILALLVLVVDLISQSEKTYRFLSWFMAIILAIDCVSLFFQYSLMPTKYFYEGIFCLDNYAIFFKQLFLFGTSMTILFSLDYAKKMSWRIEFFAMMLFSLLGMMVLASSNDFVTMFLGIELLSISCYALSGFAINQRKSSEAAVKYLIIGSISTAITLYGISLVYGATGSFTFELIVGENLFSVLGIVGSVMICIGMLFKMSIIPFHMWAPDVYEGAPTPVTGILAMMSKTAALAIFLRILFTVFNGLFAFLLPILEILAVICMIAGNIMALRQTEIKRLLAYASIAQMGYLLVGFVVATPNGIKGVIFYGVVYVLASIGAFTVLTAVDNKQSGTDCLQISGLAKSSPFLAAVMTISLLSMAGIPPMAGFVGKLYLFIPAIETGHIALAIIGFVMSMISVYYYLKVVKAMYADTNVDLIQAEKIEKWNISIVIRLAAVVGLVTTIVFGIWPEYLALLTDFVVLTFT